MYKLLKGISLLPELLVLPAYAVDVANFDELLTALTTGGNINLTGDVVFGSPDNFITTNTVIDGGDHSLSVTNTPLALPEKSGSYDVYKATINGTDNTFYYSSTYSYMAVGDKLYSDYERTQEIGTITMRVGAGSSSYKYATDEGTTKELTYSAENSSGKYVAFTDSENNLVYAYVNKTNPTPDDLDSTTKFYSTKTTSAASQVALDGFASDGEGHYTVKEHETFSYTINEKPRDIYVIDGKEYYATLNSTPTALMSSVLLETDSKSYTVANGQVTAFNDRLNVKPETDLTVKNLANVSGFNSAADGAFIYSDNSGSTTQNNIVLDNVHFEENTGGSNLVYGQNANLVATNIEAENNQKEVFYILASNANIDGTFTNNSASRGAAISLFGGGNVTVHGSFEQNIASFSGGSGGGAIAGDQNTLTIADGTTFTNNLAKKAGGGALTSGGMNPRTNPGMDGNLHIGNNVIFSENKAGFANLDGTGATSTNGKGGAVYISASGSTPTFGTGVKFLNNKAYNTGGALALNGTVYDGNGFVINNGVEFKENSAQQGGAISLLVNVNTALNNLVFDNNHATGTSAIGGAVVVSGSISNQSTPEAAAEKVNTLSINESSFVRNDSEVAGGAIGQKMITAVSNGKYSQGMTINVSRSSFDWNEAGAEGGAIVSDAILNVSGSSFERNATLGTTIGTNYADSNEGGGAIFLYDDSIATISNSTFTSNESGTWGGAISTRGISSAQPGSNSSLNVNGSTFTTNTAVYGGAIANSLTNTTEEDEITKYGSVITNTTFVENSATQFGGAIYNVGDMTITDTRNYRNGGGAFSRNTAVKGGAVYNAGSLSLDGATFVGNSATGSGGAIENKDTSAELTLNNVTFTNNNADWAGALLVRGTTTITGGSFTGNTSNDGGGAIYLATLGNKGHTLDINGTTFTNNGTLGVDVDGGGAIGSFSNLIVKNATFTGNYVGVDDGGLTSDGGGAIFMGSESNNLIEDSVFTNNTAKTWGGAISMRDTNKGNNDLNPATLDIARSTFSGNSADKGGAIYNTFHSSVAHADSAYVFSSTFSGNTANQGGAIYNAGSGTKDSVGGYLVVKDATFENNTASVAGGAIYNESVMGLVGTNVFTNNIADGVANDIKNIGTLDIAEGTTTLSGGITGNGALVLEDTGTLNLETASIKQTYFTLDGVVNAELKGADNYASFDITDAFDGTGTLNLTLKGAGDYQVFANQVFDNEHVNVLSSSIYTYNWNNNYDTLSVVAKSVDEIVESTGVEAETIKPVLTMTNSSSESLQDLANKILEKIDSNSQADKVVAESAVKTIHPETEAVVQSVATSVQTTVGNLAASRMSLPTMGRAGGDIEPTGAGFWANGLYNKSKQNGLFTGYTRGFAIGMDANFNKVLTLGTGYSYAHSNIGATHRGTSIDSYTMFIYGQYKPNAWYANAVLNYTMSDYTEQGSALGVDVIADYDVRAYGMRLATGYDLRNGITPEFGLRYTHIDADDYKNNLGIKNSLESTDYMTLTLGGKYARNFKTKVRHISLRPEFHGDLKYDVMSDEQTAVVTMPGVDSYSIAGGRLARFGAELSLGLTMKYYNADWTLDYDFEIREDYTSHTGRIKWRYNF